MTNAVFNDEASIYNSLIPQLGDDYARYLYDFMTNHSIDPAVITKAYTSYHHFLLKIKEDVPTLSLFEEKILVMLSAEVLNGKRKHEIILLDLLIHQERVSYEQYILSLQQSNCRTDEETLSSVKRVLDLSFFVQAHREKYGSLPFYTLAEDNFLVLNQQIKNSLESNVYFNTLLLDIIESAKVKTNEYDSNTPLTLYQKYTRKDVCKLLNWTSDESSTVYGYKTKHNTCPIFVTYHKNDEVDSSIKYGDELISPLIFKWYTRSNRTLQSEEVKKIIHAKENNIDVQIFVKKDDDEGSDFYYIGKAFPDKNSVQQTVMEGKDGRDVPVVCMNLILEHAVEHNLYHYLKTGHLY